MLSSSLPPKLWHHNKYHKWHFTQIEEKTFLALFPTNSHGERQYSHEKENSIFWGHILTFVALDFINYFMTFKLSSWYSHQGHMSTVWLLIKSGRCWYRHSLKKCLDNISMDYIVLIKNSQVYHHIDSVMTLKLHTFVDIITVQLLTGD